MLYHKDYKINYWLPPRCASRTTLDFLKKVGFEKTQNYHDLILFDNSWDLVVNVRNPYSAYVSYFFHTYQEDNLYFEHFIKNRFPELYHKKMETIWDVGTRLMDLNIRPKNMVRVENLEEDLMSLDFIKQNIDVLGESFDYLKLGKEPYQVRYPEICKNPYHTFYNQELADIVWERKKYSFELLGYDRDSWKTIID